MVEITTGMLKDLREKSGAGVMDCKNALKESNGNTEEALQWLRKKGLASASKKSNRVTAEGVVAVKTSGNEGILLELNSETDFVSRNDNFQAVAGQIAELALKATDIESLKALKFDDTITVAEALTNLIVSTGENLTLRRMIKVNAKGNLYSYIHNKLGEGFGKIGVLLDLEGGDVELGKQITLHIAATSPQSLSKDDLDPALVEKEKNIQREIALQSGKPAEIVEKMLDGRIAKYYQEVCLLEQAFALDNSITINKLLADSNAKINGFHYFVLGEGIEKETLDFAEEVAKAIK